MKKILLCSFILLILSACSSNKELDDFTEKFNQSARKYNTAELDSGEYKDVEKIKDLADEMEDEKTAEIYRNSEEGTRELFTSNEYTINSVYKKNDLTGYSINVKSDEDYIDKKGKGYNAALTLADSLDVDVKKFEQEMQSAFNSDDVVHEYVEDEYNIRISVINLNSASMSITFEKK